MSPAGNDTTNCPAEGNDLSVKEIMDFNMKTTPVMKFLKHWIFFSDEKHTSWNVWSMELFSNEHNLYVKQVTGHSGETF